jgi:hypothetical protein
MDLPDIAEAIEQYGIFDGPLPPYVLVGTIEMPDHTYGLTGVMCFAGNEFHANLLKKKFSKYGFVIIEKTNSHPDGETVSLDSLREFDKMFASPC